MAFSVSSLLSLAGRVARAVGTATTTSERRTGRARAPARPSPQAPEAVPADRTASARRRDAAVVSYCPSTDGRPDPGEIVWTWVAYEDDPTQGKDRPVLLIGRAGGTLLGLMLTSRDRNNARNRDERYIDIGTGAWDRQGRPSEVKVDRVLRLSAADIRREGAILPRSSFERVVAAVPDHLLA